jgi:glucose-1-phosphate cytidylyltransferase
MKVAILCGGQGTRIRDVAEHLPKPMIPIGNFPILWHIMRNYSASSFKDFILCLGYKSHVIKDFFINYRNHTSDFSIDYSKGGILEHHGAPQIDWKVTFAETGLDSMTGARVKQIHKYVKSDGIFMLTYGDGLGDVDLNALLAFHKKHGKICTVTGVRPPGRFGELMYDSAGKINEFNEKPQASGGRISGGFFVCSTKIFDYIDEGPSVVFEQDPVKRLVKDGQMMVFEHDGFWQPMDTHREYLLLNELFNKGKAPWVNW